VNAAAEAKRNGMGELPQLPQLDGKAVKRATKHAREFVRKFNPSGYDEEVVLALDREIEAPKTTRRSTPDTPATLYGRWWHELFEELKWSGDPADLDLVFQRRLATSPDPRRSSAEWKLARETLLRDSELTQFASRRGAHAHAEFPFGWSIDPQACVEGVIDLLLIDVAARECLLVDWKTNRIGNGDEEQLRKHYEPQLAAYWKAVGEITGLHVQAAIYSTSTGKLLTYNVAELSKQWTRLAALSADELRSQVVPDET
jgi:ATP-dependent exoDNAse (exonuclease V) beta subunit